MKYLILLLFLAGCTSAPLKTYEFTCGIMGGDATYANLKIPATSEFKALDQAEIVRKRLIEKNLIPDETYTMCFEGDEIENSN